MRHCNFHRVVLSCAARGGYMGIWVVLQRNRMKRLFRTTMAGGETGEIAIPARIIKRLWMSCLRPPSWCTYAPTSSLPPDVPGMAWKVVCAHAFVVFLCLDFCFSWPCSIHNCSVLIAYRASMFPHWSEKWKRGLGPGRMRQASETPAFPQRVLGLG